MINKLQRIRVCVPLAGAQAQLNGRVRAGVLGLGEEVLCGDFYLRWQVAMCLGEVFDEAGVGLSVVGNGFVQGAWPPSG
jgi:hypothetical protein